MGGGDAQRLAALLDQAQQAGVALKQQQGQPASQNGGQVLRPAGRFPGDQIQGVSRQLPPAKLRRKGYAIRHHEKAQVRLPVAHHANNGGIRQNFDLTDPVRMFFLPTIQFLAQHILFKNKVAQDLYPHL